MIFWQEMAGKAVKEVEQMRYFKAVNGLVHTPHIVQVFILYVLQQQSPALTVLQYAISC